MKKDFPIFQHKKPLIYLDNAATTHKPQVVIDAICNFYSHHYGTVHRALYSLSTEATLLYNQSRQSVQNFINAKQAEEIIFTKGTTDSINLVAKSFAKSFLKPGDEILISEIEHHSNIVPWQMVCEQYGTHLKWIPVDDQGDLCLESLDHLVTHKTKLLSIAHVSNTLGTIHPIQTLIQAAHAKGAKVLIDGAQAAAHQSIDVQALDADFYAFSGHKLYGPTGIGILYGKTTLLEGMEPITGGGDMIEKVDLTKSSYAKPPLKFEAGTPPIAQAIGLQAAIHYLSKVGIHQIQSHEARLLLYATEQLQTIPGMRLIGTSDHKAGIISFTIKGKHPLDMVTLLDFEGICVRSGHHCSQPTMKRFKIDSTLRLSLGLYNTLEDIDMCIAALKRIITKI